MHLYKSAFDSTSRDLDFLKDNPNHFFVNITFELPTGKRLHVADSDGDQRVHLSLDLQKGRVIQAKVVTRVMR